MEKILIRLAIIILFSLMQISFLPNVFRGGLATLSLLVVICWTVEIGFLAALPWIISAGILSDLFMDFPLGVNVILFTIAAYAISFLSKRFLIENRGWGLFSVAIISVLLTWFYHFSILFFNFGTDSLVRFPVQSIGFYIKTMVIIGSFFFLIFMFISWIEKHLSFYERKIDLKIK